MWLDDKICTDLYNNTRLENEESIILCDIIIKDYYNCFGTNIDFTIEYPQYDWLYIYYIIF